MRFTRLSETKLKNQVIDYLRRDLPSAWFYKSADRFTAGIPDLIICKEGMFYAVELKVNSNKATPIQEYVMREIRKAGGRVKVCRSVEEVRNFITREGGGNNVEDRRQDHSASQDHPDRSG